MTMGPHFDESLAALTAHRSAIAGALLASAASAAVVLALLVRRARPRWRCDLAPMRSAGPYRGAVIVRAAERDIPPLVRAAAASCFAYGHFFLPLIVVALATLRFDGIAVPLVPGVAIALTTWISGWLLLARAESAPEIVRASAVASLVLNVTMLGLSVAHLAYVELASQVHECSSSFAFIALVVSIASVPQSMLVLTAVSRHACAYGRDRNGAPVV